MSKHELQTTLLVVDGEELITPEAVAVTLSEAVDATFSLKQVSRLGDKKLLEPVVFKGRRLYRRADVLKLLESKRIKVSEKNPARARVRRSDARSVDETPSATD